MSSTSHLMVTKEMWDSTSIQQRVINCQFVGLEGRVGSKEWESVTPDERLALSGVTAMAGLLGVKPVEFVETEETIRARQEYWDNIRAGMRSVASDIVARALSSK